MYDSYKHLLIERRGPVLVITMNNPPNNAITEGLHRELAEIFVDISRDRDTRVVVLTGAGTAFSAGGDLNDMIDRQDDAAWWLRSMREARRIVMSMLDLDQPIVARINGPAIGLGATLALYCDIAIADENAKIGDPHVKVGLAAGDGGAIIWPLLIGFQKAKRHLLTGKALSAATAAELGLISEAVPADQLNDTVFGLCDELAALPPLAVRMTKRAVNAPLLRDVVRTMDGSLGLETLTRMSADHREALMAMKEKRKPSFRGE
jgi:enoyl-CoA hydratase